MRRMQKVVLRDTEDTLASPGGNGKDNVTQLLILRFQDMLREGVLTQGTRLPSERDLAAHFNVARSSLRQALKVLEIMGIITQKVGDGSYLNTDTSAVLSVPMEFLFLLDDTSVQELTELRLLMEPGLARLAAQRATADDIALLRKSVKDLESSSQDRLKLVSSDLLFHRAIFQASKNRTASSLFQTIHRAMAKMILVTSQLVELEHTLSFHKPIMRAIEQRKGDEAAALMQDHILDATALLMSEQTKQQEVWLHETVMQTKKPILKRKKQKKAATRKKCP
ncbi:FadR/GntR family transcriptional regulator [Edaphobacter modestus]|uniref:GntR family transcriptional regulator n=1 Tax=Edaphobacter modestus TaxID=388466 RepID=A0A4Q7YUK9_9BACT|nr:FadR/GntR family transcriptional regulator [Edaphobacter modestus]RZU40723.1 GntR family transcriptional regulator [Edaphobacter modestus]